MEKTKAAIRDAKDVAGELAGSLERLSGFAKAVCSLSLRSAMDLEHTLEAGSDNLEKGVRAAIKANQDLEALFAENPDPKKLLEDGALKYELALSREAIGKIEEDSDHQVLRAKEYQEQFWAMAEGSFSFLKAVEASRKKFG